MKYLYKLLVVISGIGLLRFLFAISVVIEHSSNGHPAFNFVNGVVAVQSFFIMSGFYMAMILSQKYTEYSTFIGNRFLRIYPMYFVVLFLSIIVSIISTIFIEDLGAFSYYRQYLNSQTLFALLPILFTNLSLFGQDLVMFMGIDITNANLYFTKNFLWSDPGLWNFLFVPQAWTLSLELIFYLIAPLMNKWKSVSIFLFILWSLCVRFLLAQLGYTGDPWVYRFLPSELAFFASGMLSYRAYHYFMLKKPVVLQKYAGIITLSMIILVVTFLFNPVNYEIRRWMYYVIFASLLPWVFYFSKDNKSDRRIGELSYPIYITHILVLNIFQLSYFSIFQKHLMFLSVVIIVISTGFSLLLNRYIQHPIDQIRAARVRSMNM